MFRWAIMWRMIDLGFLICQKSWTFTAKSMKFSINDFFSKYDQIRRKLRIWSRLLKKSLMENFIFCPVIPLTDVWFCLSFRSFFLYVTDFLWHMFSGIPGCNPFNNFAALKLFQHYLLFLKSAFLSVIKGFNLCVNSALKA